MPIALLATYEEWFPYLLAFVYVLVHHGLMGALESKSVFNDPSAQTHPWRWAAVHALFISALGVVNLDPGNPQAGWFTVDGDARAAWGITRESFTVTDELSGGTYTWGTGNYVALHPWGTAAHVCRLEGEVAP